MISDKAGKMWNLGFDQEQTNQRLFVLKSGGSYASTDSRCKWGPKRAATISQA